MKKLYCCAAFWVLLSTLRLSPALGLTTEEALTELETYAVGCMNQEGVPGLAYAVVKDGSIIYAKGFGVRQMGNASPVTESTVFEIASSTKAFTTTMIAMLVEEGKLAWTDKVTAHMPDFRMKDPWVTKEIEIADLLCHRSGLPAYALDGMTLIGFGRDSMVHALRYVAPVTSFRSAYAYQNVMLQVAGKVIERKTNLSWDDNLDLRIIGPLGMNDTTSRQEVVDLMTNVARGHAWLANGSLWITPSNWAYKFFTDIDGPAGGIRSSAQDMAKWVGVQLGRGSWGGQTIVHPSSIEYLFAPRTLIEDAPLVLSYASGWIYLPRSPHPLIFHGGNSPGFTSQVALVPEANVGIVVLCNLGNSTSPNNVMKKFYELFCAEPTTAMSSLKFEIPETPMSPLPASQTSTDRNLPVLKGTTLPPGRYCGVYSNPAYGKFSVRLESGSLVMIMGPREIRATLKPLSGNIFTMTLPDFPSQDQTQVVFSVSPGCPAGSFTFADGAFQDVNKGVFSRIQ
jgi:CubicO group peptidase (beta-lactamase class C family)